jgi:hypothetical protein
MHHSVCVCVLVASSYTRTCHSAALERDRPKQTALRCFVRGLFHAMEYYGVHATSSSIPSRALSSGRVGCAVRALMRATAGGAVACCSGRTL